MKPRGSWVLAGALALLLGALHACASTEPRTYASPEEAMHCLADTAVAKEAAFERCVGPGASEIFVSGDPQADREDLLEIREALEQRLAFEDAGEGRKVALLGDERWPFPIPLVREQGRWRFDVASGKEELLNRRIGANELMAIAALREYVEAQHEYAARRSPGDPPVFAPRMTCSPDDGDGLYDPDAASESECLFGPLVACATYEADESDSKRPPCHGYYFRVLTAQATPGGERSYLDERGRMSGGFAMLAWPAEYGVTGVMSFQVDELGIVFQRDLGPDTAEAVAQIRAYDPEGWYPTRD